MAITLPGIQYLQGYRGDADLVGRFKQGYDFTGGIVDEIGAKDALGEYVKSLYQSGQPQARPSAAPMPYSSPAIDTGSRLVNGSISAATAATDPALSAALERKMPGSTAPAGPDGAARQAMQFFIGKGYSPPQAAGIVGNLMHESGLSTGARNPGDGRDGSDSIGIAQWNADRATGLQAFATQIGGDPNDLMTQLAYVEHELQGPESKTREALLQANDPIAATRAFVGYERPQGWTPETPTAALGFGSRAKNAASLMGGEYQVADAGGGAPVPQSADNGLPPREVLAKLFANPVTRSFGAELVQSAQKGTAPPTLTDDMKEYMLASQDPAFAQFLRDNKAGSSTNVTVNSGSDDFYTAADKKRGEDFVATEVAGTKAASNIAQLSRLEQLLETAPQGMEGAWKGFAGQFGINSEGLDDIQAAQALINSMVPDQRPPGSGTMSDADLALFKASIPSIINQPGGNGRILQTLRGIAIYDQEIGQIATKVLDRTLTPAQGRAEMAKVVNPLDAFKTSTQRAPDQPPAGITAEEWGAMSEEDRALWK